MGSRALLQGSSARHWRHSFRLFSADGTFVFDRPLGSIQSKTDASGQQQQTTNPPEATRIKRSVTLKDASSGDIWKYWTDTSTTSGRISSHKTRGACSSLLSVDLLSLEWMFEVLFFFSFQQHLLYATHHQVLPAVETGLVRSWCLRADVLLRFHQHDYCALLLQSVRRTYRSAVFSEEDLLFLQLYNKVRVIIHRRLIEVEIVHQSFPHWMIPSLPLHLQSSFVSLDERRTCLGTVGWKCRSNHQRKQSKAIDWCGEWTNEGGLFQVPVAFLVILLIQFILIIIDRALYLRRNVRGKLFFQLFQVIAVHIWLFFVLPGITRTYVDRATNVLSISFVSFSSRKFRDNVAAQFWYIFKCIYFGYSSIQVRLGYPKRIAGNFLMKRFNYVNQVLYRM